MDNPALYVDANLWQRNDAKLVIEEYSSKFKWRYDGTDSLLDIGCGSGDVLMDFIYPIMAKNMERLVGVDYSANMVEFCRKKYRYPRVSFEILDVAIPLKFQSFATVEPFDHVTSFYCLHWMKSHEIALKNVSNLLKPGGDALLVFLNHVFNFEVTKKLLEKNKWTKYLADMNKGMPKHQFNEHPVEELTSLLLTNGFAECDVKLLDKTQTFDKLEDAKGKYFWIPILIWDYTFHIRLACFRAIDPFIERIPKADRDAYMDDVWDELVELDFIVTDAKCEPCKFEIPYKLFVAYATK